MFRDFSNSSKQNLLDLVLQVENEKWSDFTDWIGDHWYDFETWIGKLDIKNYINIINSYHKKVIDKNNTTKEKIENVFSQVKSVDTTYYAIFNNITLTLSNIQKYLVELDKIVTPGKGLFNAEPMKVNLESVLSEIQSYNVKNLKNQMVQDIDGELVFNEDLIYEYIKKDPNELSGEEKEMLIDVLAELQDIINMYETLASHGTEEIGLDILTRISWLSDSDKYDSFTGVSTHYNEIYVNLLNFILETSEESNSFAASLVKISNGESDTNILGVEYTQKLVQIFGGASLVVYAEKYSSEHSEQYFGKLSATEKAGQSAGVKINGLNKAIKDKLIDKDKYSKIDRKTEFFDEDGNTVRDDIPDFYEKEIAVAEWKKKAGISASLYEGAFDLQDFGNLDVVVGNAEAHAGVSAGLYVSKTDADGKIDRVFSPGVDAEIGASVTALSVGWENQLLGDENFGMNADASISAGKVSAKADIGAQLYNEDGNLDVQLEASASAEAIAAEAEGSIGINVLGGEVGVSGSVNVGVGAHADVGYKDGVFKFDVGASLGVGVSFGVEIDVGGMVDTVCDKAETAWDNLKEGWNNIWN